VLLNNILVALDGSPLAEAALPFAEAVASRTGARVTLVRAACPRSMLREPAPADQQRVIEGAETYLQRLAQDLGARGLKVETAVPFGGAAAEWIVEECDFRKGDLVIMATHDRVGPDRWLHGSVAESVVHRSTAPVMLVHGADAQELAKRFVCEQPVLVVPLDGSDLAEAALPLARALARVVGARLVLVGVVPPPGQLVAVGGAVMPYTSDDFDQIEADAKHYLRGSLNQLASAVPVEVVMRYGDPAVEIAATAEEHAAAAVIMATHGRTGVLRSVLGSVAGGVVHRCTTPVILMRSRAMRELQQDDWETEACRKTQAVSS
jgi:nucleotide-binding universal stress UspA family protein